MASQHSRKIEVLRIIFLFIAILAVIAALFCPASLAQGALTGRRFATSVKPGQEQTLFNPSMPSSLFLPVAIYDSGGIGPVALAVGDLNGDGHPDVVVANYCDRTSCNGGIVSVLLGNGNGTFRTPVSYNTGGNNPWSIAIGDLNGDGSPDLVVANLCQRTNCNNGTISVLFGNGDGTFRAPTLYNAGGYWNFSVVIGDVNGDGNPDLVVGNYLQCVTCAEGAVSVFLGNGDGTFRAPVSYSSAGYEVYSVAMGDVNRDGRTDLVVTNNCQSSTVCPGPGGLSVLLGNGDGTFQPAVPYYSGGYWGPDAVVIVDVNGNGIPDLVASNYCLSGSICPGPGDVAVLLGNGDGTFQRAVSYSSGGYHVFLVAVGDVNGDGYPDLIVANECDSASCNYGVAGVLLGNGDGTFQAAQTYSSGGSTPYAVVVTDVNGDGKPDVIMANAFSNTVGVLLNDARIFTKTTLTSSRNPSFIGHAVTFTATVTSMSGIPPNGETITFYNGTAVLGAAPLSGGTAVLTTSSLPAGTFTIKATYPGDSTFAASASAGLRQVVNSTTRSATSTTLASSLNPSIYGQKVIFSAMITTTGPVPPTGSVVFTWQYFTETFTIGTATLNSSGVATLIKTGLNADLYPLTAVYRGDINNLGSTSPVLNQAVRPTTSAATITSLLNPSSLRQAVTFTTKISSPTVMPTGPVTFTAGTRVLGTAQLGGGKATFTTSSLAAGSTKVTVTYYGDSNIAKSSASVSQTVR